MDGESSSGPIPPKAGGNATRSICRHIPEVGGTVMQPERADELADQRPYRKMRPHFRPSWREIVFAQTRNPLDPQHYRQSRRNQEQIIKVAMQKRRREQRLEQPAIQRIGCRRAKKQPIVQIPEAAHNNAHMTKPVATARSVFKSITIMGNCNANNAVAQEAILYTPQALLRIEPCNCAVAAATLDAKSCLLSSGYSRPALVSSVCFQVIESM